MRHRYSPSPRLANSAGEMVHVLAPVQPNWPASYHRVNTAPPALVSTSSWYHSPSATPVQLKVLSQLFSVPLGAPSTATIPKLAVTLLLPSIVIDTGLVVSL